MEPSLSTNTRASDLVEFILVIFKGFDLNIQGAAGLERPITRKLGNFHKGF